MEKAMTSTSKQSGQTAPGTPPPKPINPGGESGEDSSDCKTSVMISGDDYERHNDLRDKLRMPLETHRQFRIISVCDGLSKLVCPRIIAAGSLPEHIFLADVGHSQLREHACAEKGYTSYPISWQMNAQGILVPWVTPMWALMDAVCEPLS